MLVYLMLTVAGLGAFISSTGVVAIFLPVVLSVSMRMNISPSRLMMPLLCRPYQRYDDAGGHSAQSGDQQ
ncbi:SLC13 family permease [Shigella flexneri]